MRVPTTVVIGNASITLNAVGASVSISVTVRDQNGAVISNPDVSFTSLDQNVVTVSPTGVVTSVANGSTDVVVTSGVASDQVGVVVDQQASELTIVSGNEQVGEPEATLGSPLVVRVTDAEGTVVPGESVAFAVLSGGGAVSAASVTTAANGQASVDWTLGSEGAQTVRASSGSEMVTFTAFISVLQDGVPLTGLSGAFQSERFFTFEVPPGAGEGQVLEVSTGGGSGDVGIAVRHGAPPNPSNFDCGSFAADFNFEFCAITNPQAGTWHIVLVGFDAYAGVSLGARMLPLTTLEDGVPATGLSAQTDEFLYFAFEVPGSSATEASVGTEVVGGDGSRVLLGWEEGQATSFLEYRNRTPPARGDVVQPQVGTSTLTATTSGGTGDVDLFGGSAGHLSQTVPIECISAVDGNDEECVIGNPTAGEWQFLLVAFQAFSGVTFEVDFTPADPPGTITIQKEVQSSTGGTPDNPANPDLSGFQFQIREAGTTTVVTTVTTDASGQAVATVPAGTYDVVESQSQGLTDVTGAADGLVVAENGNVEVDWINRQPAPGNMSPIAILNASPTSVPQGDGNSTVVMLYAGNSTDADGDPLTYTWVVESGTFVESTDANSEMAKVTFPGTDSYAVTLTVDDGNGGQDVAQTTIALGPALPPAGTFNIELVNIATPSQTVQDALDAAVETWEMIVRSELSNIDFSGSPIAADACIEGQPEIDDVVDDLRIYVDISSIDGPGMVLGRAGPCVIRTANDLPIVGFMNFDSDDLDGLSGSDLSRVILHEMGHVLGIGSLWGLFGFRENPSCPDQMCDAEDPPGPDTRYTGPAGVGAWRSFGGSNTEDVPVENGEGVMAGPGARDSHWREVIFDRELMTGFLDSGQTNPLSKLTIASLLDLGYVVAFSKAEPYTLPSLAPSAVLGEGRIIDLGDDIAPGPIYVVDDQGGVVRVLHRR